MNPSVSSASVARLLAQASDRGERIVSAARSVFIGASLARTLSLHWFDPAESGLNSARFLLGSISAVTVLGVSAWFVLRPKQHLAPTWAIWLSIALDAVTLFTALLSNVLWPWPEYPGLLGIPDFAAVLVIIAVAGFRFLPGAALFGGALNIAGFLTLIAVDHRVSGGQLSYGASQVVLVLVLAGATATLSFFTALRTRHLVQRAALESLRAEQSNMQLMRLLHDQHDAKNVVASSLLLSEWVEKQAVSGGYASKMADVARKLHRDVKRVAELVSDPARVSQAELAKQPGPQLSTAAAALDDVFEQLGEHYAVRFERALAEPEAKFWVTGGEAGLRRIFFNLLLNCCQGDGSSAASRVRVTSEQRGSQIIYRIEDDGPGFRRLEPVAAKASGWGLGLDLVTTLVESSGGQFQWGDRPDASGAFFELTFMRG